MRSVPKQHRIEENTSEKSHVQPLAERLGAVYRAARLTADALRRYMSVIRAIQTYKVPVRPSRQYRAMAALANKQLVRNQALQAKNLEDLIVAMGDMARAGEVITVEIVDLYDAGDPPFQIWQRKGGYRVAALTALDALESASMMILLETAHIYDLEIDWYKPIDVQPLRTAIASLLNVAVPRWRAADDVDLPTDGEMQALALRLSREGRAAMRKYGQLGIAELSLGEQQVWKGLEHKLCTAESLARACGATVQVVKNHVSRIRVKRGRTAILRRGRLGYYRPDSPPNWSETKLPIKRKRHQG